MHWYGRNTLTSSVSVRSIPAEQSDKGGFWESLNPYVAEQAAQPVVRSLRILIVATEAPPVHGGIARIVGYLQNGFLERGHQVDVLAYPEVKRLAFNEVRLSSLIFKLPRLLRRINEYDVIHIHGATPTISDVALLFARLCGSSALVVYTHHMDMEFGPGGFFSRIYNYFHHQLSNQADVVITSTRDYLRLLNDRGRGLVIPLGVDLEQFSTRGQKDAQFTVLFIGQFRPYKGVRVLLQAMSQVKGARLIIAGQGPEEQAYRSLGAELCLDVEFHVGVSDDQLCHLYQRAHAVVLPSISCLEAFGLTLVEGMAAGCVPIASDLPGVREVVGQSGFLFPVRDANRLAGILCGLSNSPELVQEMSDSARARAVEFGQERTLFEYERLITGMVACRDLKNRLADQTPSYTLALQDFVTEIARHLEADWTEIMLCQTGMELYSAAVAESTGLLDRSQFQQASSLLAWYALNKGNNILVGAEDGPIYLRNVLGRGIPAAMAIPLTVNGEHFGVLLAIRKWPFNQQDLSNLNYFAHSITPSLRPPAHSITPSLRSPAHSIAVKEANA